MWVVKYHFSFDWRIPPGFGIRQLRDRPAYSLPFLFLVRSAKIGQESNCEQPDPIPHKFHICIYIYAMVSGHPATIRSSLFTTGPIMGMLTPVNGSHGPSL